MAPRSRAANGTCKASFRCTRCAPISTTVHRGAHHLRRHRHQDVIYKGDILDLQQAPRRRAAEPEPRRDPRGRDRRDRDRDGDRDRGGRPPERTYVPPVAAVAPEPRAGPSGCSGRSSASGRTGRRADSAASDVAAAAFLEGRSAPGGRTTNRLKPRSGSRRA